MNEMKGGLRMYRLIIIDDEKEISQGFAQFFPWASLGFEVAGTFARAKEAIAFLENEAVDVIVSDVRMPGVTGLEMAEQINRQKLRGGAKLLFFSAYGEFSYAQQAIALGADQYILKSASYNELIEVFRKLKETLDDERKQAAPDHEDRLIAQILAYAKEHLDTASLEEVSAQVFLSPSYVSRYFKQQTGQNFADYMMELRMKRAAELLTMPEQKIYAISESLGYANPINFSRAFKRYYEMTPQQYRQKNLKSPRAL